MVSVIGGDDGSTINSMSAVVGASDHTDKVGGGSRRSRHSKTSKETRSSDDNDTDTPVDVSTYTYEYES